MNINKILAKIQQSELPRISLPPQFRVSSLPFCPLLHVLEHKQRTTHNEFSSQFYFKIGHSLHELWQEAAANAYPNSVLGDWQCNKILTKAENGYSEQTTKCNRLAKFCTLNEAKNQPCPHKNLVKASECKAAQEHSEFSYKDIDLSGHSDLIFRHNKKYHLWDFKTTSSFLFDRPDIAIGRGYYPNKKYIEQLESYVILFEKKYKIKLDTYSIVYISRDRANHSKEKPAFHVFTFKITNEMRNKRRKLLKTYHKQYKIAQKWLDAKPNARNTEKLWESRPCLTKKIYYTHMKKSFFKECPQLDSCFSGKLKKELIRYGKQRD